MLRTRSWECAVCNKAQHLGQVEPLCSAFVGDMNCVTAAGERIGAQCLEGLFVMFSCS